jgi:hypothetical protein
MAKPSIKMVGVNADVHGKIQFEIRSGDKHLGNLTVDDSGVVWSDSWKHKGHRLLWAKLQELSKAGYKVKA